MITLYLWDYLCKENLSYSQVSFFLFVSFIFYYNRNPVACAFSVMAQPYRVVRPAAHTSGLMMWDVLEQRSVLMTVAIQVGGLKTVGLQRQLKLFVKVKFYYLYLLIFSSFVNISKQKDFLTMVILF